MGNLPFLASMVASLEVSELIKLLTNKGNTLRNKMLYIDLKENTYNIFEL
jgi:molybdopterin/thiamine biosynthesis adenylyltransferase